MAGFEPGDDHLDWGTGCIRGLGKKKKFVRTEKDADGNDVNIYELEDDEWEIKYGSN